LSLDLTAVSSWQRAQAIGMRKKACFSPAPGLDCYVKSIR
jgi:hypothetical protein